jgi:hypothetical protein
MRKYFIDAGIMLAIVITGMILVSTFSPVPPPSEPDILPVHEASAGYPIESTRWVIYA